MANPPTLGDSLDTILQNAHRAALDRAQTLEDALADGCRTIIDMGQEIHRAYHAGDPTTCMRGFCVGARNVVDGLRARTEIGE